MHGPQFAHYPPMPPKFTDVDVSQIAGNVSVDVKEMMLEMADFGVTGFAHEIFSRLKLTEVSVQPKAEEPGKMEGRVVFETVVEDGEFQFGISHGIPFNFHCFRQTWSMVQGAYTALALRC